MATGAESGKLRQMVLSVKAQIPGKLVFLLTQLVGGKLLNGPTILTDHKAMTTFRGVQVTPDKSTGG